VIGEPVLAVPGSARTCPLGAGDYVISDVTLTASSPSTSCCPSSWLHGVRPHRGTAQGWAQQPTRRDQVRSPRAIVGTPNAPQTASRFHPYYHGQGHRGRRGPLPRDLPRHRVLGHPLGGLFPEARTSSPPNPLQTPAHIAPVWYFTPCYAMLRALPPVRFGSQFPGVVVCRAILILSSALARPQPSQSRCAQGPHL